MMNRLLKLKGLLGVVVGLVLLGGSGGAVSGGVGRLVTDDKRGDEEAVGWVRQLGAVEGGLKRYYSRLTWKGGVLERERLGGTGESGWTSAMLEGVFAGGEYGFLPRWGGYSVVEGVKTGGVRWQTRLCVVVGDQRVDLQRELGLRGYSKKVGSWTERSCGGSVNGGEWYYKDVDVGGLGTGSRLGGGLVSEGLKEQSVDMDGKVGVWPVGVVVPAGATKWGYKMKTKEYWVKGICGMGTGGVVEKGGDGELLRGWQERCAQVAVDDVMTTEVVVSYVLKKEGKVLDGWTGSECILSTTTEVTGLGGLSCTMEYTKGPSALKGVLVDGWTWIAEMVAVAQVGSVVDVQRTGIGGFKSRVSARVH